MLAMTEKSKESASAPIRDRAWHVEAQLENWARWMGGLNRPDALPNKASGGFQNATSMDWDTCDAEYERMNLQHAVTCNAVINGIDPVEGAAIITEYLHAVFRFNRCNFYDVLQRAKRSVARGLIAKGVWLGS